jgi:integrase
MIKRRDTSDRLTVDRIAELRHGVISESGDVQGVALEVKASRNGKTKVGYARYNGIPFGEPRVARLRLGNYDDLGLPQLRRLRVDVEDLIRKGKGPKQHWAKAQEQQRAQGMTLRQAIEEYYEFGRRKLWKAPRTRILMERIKRLHLDGLPIMDLPLESIRATHLAELLGPNWETSGNARKIRSILCSTFQFQMDKDDGLYRGSNPALWRKKAPLSRKLGDQLPSRHHPGPEPEEIPFIVQYLRTRHDGVPGYVTGAEAAHAWDKPYSTVKTLTDRDRFAGIIKHPTRRSGLGVNLIPVAELEARFGKPKHPPVQLVRHDVWLYDRLVQVLIFTPVRANNVCGEVLRSPDVPELHGLLVGGLRWRNIYPDRDGGIIEFLPRRRDPDDPTKELPSEHKLGWKHPVKYIVILTDNLRAFIEEQHQLQISDGVKIEPNGLVFLHGRTRTGMNINTGKHLGWRAAEDHLQAAVDHLVERGIIKTKKITPHGLRTSFTTWASKHGYDDKLIELSMGHILPAIRVNSSNWAYYHRVVESLTDERRHMMKHWERHCLSLCKPILVSSSASA